MIEIRTYYLDSSNKMCGIKDFPYNIVPNIGHEVCISGEFHIITNIIHATGKVMIRTMPVKLAVEKGVYKNFNPYNDPFIKVREGDEVKV